MVSTTSFFFLPIITLWLFTAWIVFIQDLHWMLLIFIIDVYIHTQTVYIFKLLWPIVENSQLPHKDLNLKIRYYNISNLYDNWRVWIHDNYDLMHCTTTNSELFYCLKCQFPIFILPVRIFNGQSPSLWKCWQNIKCNICNHTFLTQKVIVTHMHWNQIKCLHNFLLDHRPFLPSTSSNALFVSSDVVSYVFTKR